MILGLLGLIFPFVKGLLGDGLVEKVLNHKRAQAETASAERKANLDADIKVIEFEQDRRHTIKELQLKEYEHPLLWWPKFLIMMAVALYWFGIFMHTTLGLADFGIVIADLTPAQEAVSVMVLTYMFVGNKIERIFSKKD